MALDLHAFGLLLMVILVPLAVTATFSTVEATDHGIIPEGGPGFINNAGITIMESGMPACLTGACDVSEIYIWPGRHIHCRSISYESLKKSFVPCNLRGKSYYNCLPGTQVNPYRRRCISAITQCARIMD